MIIPDLMLSCFISIACERNNNTVLNDAVCMEQKSLETTGGAAICLVYMFISVGGREGVKS